MGGGDLNMKKSWHPALGVNMERVWKEENKALLERKKLQELQKEHEQERIVQELQRLQHEAGGTKREERVDWMYAAPAESQGANAEELELYLLGKKRVDKLLQGNHEKLLASNAAATAAQPGGSFTSLQNANSARDTASKIREDPLLAIKRQEQAQYDKILRDPKRLRELRAKRESETPRVEIKGPRKHKKDETRDERRIRKEEKARREEGGERTRERERERERPRGDEQDHRPRHDGKRDEISSRRDRDSDHRTHYSDSYRPPPHSRYDPRDTYRRSRSRSPPRSYPPPPPIQRDPSSITPHAPSRSTAPRPPPALSPSEIAARESLLAARLEKMQSSALQLSTARSARLVALETEDAVQLAEETRLREKNDGRNGQGGVGPSFLREQEKQVFGGGMELGERMRRQGGVGIKLDRE